MAHIAAHARNIRQSARKVRLVVDVIRGMSVHGALAQLSVMTKAARVPVEKVLRSALANAENNFGKNASDLFIQEVQVNMGTALKRWRPRAFGRAAPIKKHACSISVVLGEAQGAAGKSGNIRRKDAIVVETLEPVLSVSDAGAPAHDVSAPAVPHEAGVNRQAPFDKSRAGRHETSQKIRKEKKISMLKKIIQRKTGSS
ncbi:50S ribosomal protein L22 [Candidatus Uhrbacteria bacterium]|nr:50S ribosomal protein L22 [Candidatus Uhrbacteria bacterium]